MTRVAIIGAGISGLVAAISCARDCREVTIYEKAETIGGNTIPTIYSTPLVDINQFEHFLGINLSKSVEKTKGETICPDFIYKLIHPGLTLYNLERGPRKSSIDTYLYKLAMKEGVNIEFNREINNLNEIKADKYIIAVGISKMWMEKLGIHYSTYNYVHGYCISNCKTRKMVIVNNQISPSWYSHIGSLNGILSAVVLSRMHISKSNWDKLVSYLKRRNIIKGDFKKCVFSEGRSPDKAQLFVDKYILTGTIAGTSDPVVYYGALQSMVSGKISAVAVKDPKKARSMFNLIFGFRFISNLLGVYSYLPNNEFIQELFLRYVPWSIKKSYLSFDISQVI